MHCAWILHVWFQTTWESWAWAGFVRFIHQDFWESCVCERAEFYTCNFKSLSKCPGPRFPRIKRKNPAPAQDSKESRDFLGTIRQALDKVPKNLGNLGPGQVLYTLSVEFLLENIEPMHELCTVFFKAFRDFGLSQVLFESNTSLELEFAMQIPYKN